MTNDVVGQRLGRLVREASEAAEVQRQSSMAARRSDLAARQRLGAAIGGTAVGGRRWVFAMAAVALVALTLVATGPSRSWMLGGGSWMFGGGVLDFEVAGTSEVGGYVRAGEGPATVTFEDGSNLVFAPGSAGRVSEATEHGARIALEDGSVDVQITKLPGADWALRAGPWEVRVIGTAFRLAWDARARSLRVDLREGKVSVRGPGAEEGVGLRAGQSLVAQEATGIRLTSTEAASAASASAASAPASSEPAVQGTPAVGSHATASASGPAEGAPAAASGPVEGAAVPTEGAVASAPPSVSRVGWSARVAAGEFDAVLAEADERGIDSVLATASAADLVALGDAARYRGRSGVASRSLSALRDRFAGTTPAANAAFLLARMADDGGSAASAIRWYDVHMAEGGAFATEALGRKMLAVRRSQGDAAAAPVARQYLSRHPLGPHAPAARSLVGETGAPSAPTNGAPTNGAPTNGAPTNGGPSPR